MTNESQTRLQREYLLNKLMATVQDLPKEKIVEVSDFAGYLQAKYQEIYPVRGSAEDILRAMDDIGPLQFEPSELDGLLADIDQMRAMDMDEND